jgi:hydroxylaminobenzene mutase
MADDSLSRRLAWAGAWLFAVGMVTGLWAAIVLTERVVVQLPRLALAAHLNALLGGLWLIAVAATVDMLRYGPIGRGRLAWVLITLIASILGVTGLEYTRGDPANNVVAALLHSVVVLPSLVGAGAWAWGLGGKR